MFKHTIFTIIICLPILLLGQKKSWHLEAESGFNLSANKMILKEGSKSVMHNKISVGGLWGFHLKYQVSNRTLLNIGVDHVTYKTNYTFGEYKRREYNSKSQIWVWGFPIGVENQWLVDRKLEFATGYGLKYRLNQFGNASAYQMTSSYRDPRTGYVLNQNNKEFDSWLVNHMLAMYLYTKLIIKINSHFHFAFKANYNQGLTTHEKFKFESITHSPSDGTTAIHSFQYKSKVSYFSFGFSLSYILHSKKQKE